MTPRSRRTANQKAWDRLAESFRELAESTVAPLRELFAEADYPPEVRSMLVRVVICKLIDLLGEST